MLRGLASTASLTGRVQTARGIRAEVTAASSQHSRARAGIAGAGKRAPSRAHGDPVAIERAKGQAKRQPRSRALVIGCGALARELVEVTATLPGVDVACLSPDLHNRPGGIPAAVRARIHEARRDGYERIF